MRRPFLSTDYAKRSARDHRAVLRTIQNMIGQFPELAPMVKECKALNHDKFVRAFRMSSAFVAFMAYWDSRKGHIFQPLTEKR